MSGDYSRKTYDEARRYCALWLQQGRVLLDADFNEMVEILKERTRKLSLDAMGDPGIPFLTNPDAFEVTLAPGPLDLQVTPGRIYVDGHLAEVFEDESFTYLTQPFLPDPPDLPDGDAAIVLCLWEEEITWVHNPDLLDPALGGVDTANRLSTRIQLLAEPVEAAECGLDVGPPPSAGRLTTRAIAPPTPDDPCILPPTGGYRGLENRLYRFEIHEGGPMGVATFKWSRDNGSILVPVEAMTPAGQPTELSVARIGRDPVLRFEQGDWVTITDDHRSWMDEPGEMAQVTDTIEGDDGATIVLDRDITGLGRPFAASPADRHTRVQKWDQHLTTDPTLIPGDGVIPTQPGPLTIDEAGIEITFSTAAPGGDFRRGDYWCVWARTATATIDELTDAPPDGIHRHYVQLAAASGLGDPDPEITDCRPQEPEAGEGCCTIVVRPGESIQAAIDALPPEGGCICLKTGVHPVPGTLQLNRANVHMHGESPGTILRGAAPLLQLGTAAVAIRIEMIDFNGRVSQQGNGAILLSQGAQDLTVEDCRFAPFEGGNGGVAIFLERTDRARITGNAILNTNFGVVVAGLSDFPVIEKNDMVFGFGRDDAVAATGIWIIGNPSACHIEDNVILGAFQGILINDDPQGTPRSLSASTLIADNAVLAGGFEAATGPATLGIDSAADFTTITGNNVFVLGAQGVGIRASGAGSTLASNNVGAAGGQATSAIGIQIGSLAGMDNPDTPGPQVSATTLIVRDNQIAGEVTGIAVFNAFAAALSGNNVVTTPGRRPTAGILAFNAPLLTAQSNRIGGSSVGVFSAGGSNTALRDNDMAGCPTGIFVMDDERPELHGNRVGGARQLGIAAARILGRTQVTGNRVTNAGSAADLAIGIGGLQIIGDWHVSGNEVNDTGQTADGEMPGGRAIGILGLLILQARIESNLVTYTNGFGLDPAREDRALSLLGLAEFVVNTGQFQQVFGFPVQILGNHFSGAGASALVELLDIPLSDVLRMRFERVLMSNNYCFHVSGPFSEFLATVVLSGRFGTVGGNQVKATVQDFPSFDFNGMDGPFFGNVLSGPTLGYSGFPAATDGLHNLRT